MQLSQILNETESKFKSLSKEHKEVLFEQECNHALYLLSQNNFLMDIAKKNPESLKMAIYQLASVGLTLNPTKRHGYLVPYGGKSPKVCFIPGYCGLVHLAVSSGSIEWVKADIVHDGDEFTYTGPGEKPVHQYDPFADNRGSMDTAKGAYCVAKTTDGAFLTEMMSKSEILNIRNRSESFKSGKQIGPWFSDEGEMWKKTVIRRAEKLWPKTSRLSEAVGILNDNDGLMEPHIEPKKENFKELKNMVDSIPGDTESKLVGHVNTKFKNEYDSINDFNSDEVDYSITFLSQFAG